ELDQKIDEILGYSKNKKYGYLTSYPNNCGTGLRASVMLELSGLSETRNMKSVFNALSNYEVNIKQVEDTKSIYEISNTRTIGITEEDIVRGIKVSTQKIIDQEREIRKFLAKDGVSLEDKVYRSYGILLNCRRLSYEESKEYISML